MTAVVEPIVVTEGQTTVEEQLAATEAERIAQERSAKNAAYNAAWSKLREKYRAEYDALLEAEFTARGLVHRRRSTSEQAAEKAEQAKLERAKARMDKLIAEYPALAEGLKQK